MKPENRPNQHAAYLLRIWRTSEDAEWRVFLQDVHTGEQRGFRDFEALVAFFEGTQRHENAAEGSAERGGSSEERGTSRDWRLETGNSKLTQNETGMDESEANIRDDEEDVPDE